MPLTRHDMGASSEHKRDSMPPTGQVVSKRNDRQNCNDKETGSTAVTDELSATC